MFGQELLVFLLYTFLFDFLSSLLSISSFFLFKAALELLDGNSLRTADAVIIFLIPLELDAFFDFAETEGHFFSSPSESLSDEPAQLESDFGGFSLGIVRH